MSAFSQVSNCGPTPFGTQAHTFRLFFALESGAFDEHNAIFFEIISPKSTLWYPYKAWKCLSVFFFYKKVNKFHFPFSASRTFSLYYLAYHGDIIF